MQMMQRILSVLHLVLWLAWVESFRSGLIWQNTANVPSDSRLHARNEKAKKPAQNSNGEVNPKPSYTPVPVPRVSRQVNIPVRQQIMWAKMNRRLQQTTRNNHLPTKFKKKETEKVAPELYVEIDYHNTPPPALFVDGYNVLGQMDNSIFRKTGGDLEAARDSLIADLCVLQDATGWWIEVVFDAYRGGRAQHQERVDGLLITYTKAGESADSYIEHRFHELAARNFTNMVVATDDRMVQIGTTSECRGYLSTAQLLEEIQLAYASWDQFVQEMNEESRKRAVSSVYVSEETQKVIDAFRAEYAARLYNQTATIQSPSNVSTDACQVSMQGLSKRQQKKQRAHEELLRKTAELCPTTSFNTMDSLRLSISFHNRMTDYEKERDVDLDCGD